MKKFSGILILMVCFIFLVASNAISSPVPFGDGGDALQKVLDDITVSPNPGQSSVDVNIDGLSDSSDSYWNITGTGGSITTLIIEVAAFAPNNKFGVYNGNKYVQIFDGAAASGAQASLSILVDGSVKVNFVDTGIDFNNYTFGYYLDSSVNADGGGGLWHSDTLLNTDGMDHMAAYQGKNIDKIQIPGFPGGLWTNNEYVLAFEDLKASVTDGDYTDMVLMVESVNPVPEPATLLLFGFGLLGLAAIDPRKFFKKA